MRVSKFGSVRIAVLYVNFMSGACMIGKCSDGSTWRCKPRYM